MLTFYIDNFFERFLDFISQFPFFHNYFLPQVAWAQVQPTFIKSKDFKKENYPSSHGTSVYRNCGIIRPGYLFFDLRDQILSKMEVKQ